MDYKGTLPDTSGSGQVLHQMVHVRSGQVQVQPDLAGQVFLHSTSTLLSNYNTKSLYHFENSVIVALKSDIFTFYTCQINKGDILLQFEKLKKKSPNGAVIQKYQKQILKGGYLYY